MSETDDRRAAASQADGETPDAASGGRARTKLKGAMAGAKGASDRHVAIAVPLRAVERNQRIAASVLAGGIAYRLFLWLLPFGLVVGGAFGLGNATNTEDAVQGRGIPGAITNAIGDASRSAHHESWWLFLVGVPLLLWAGYSGAKAIALIHALVWDEPPPKPKPLQSSLAFTGVVCAFLATIALTWWVREDWPGLLAPVLTLTPLAAIWLWVSLHLPHRDAPWTSLIPGALLVALGFQVLHEVIGHFLVSKLEKATDLYGGLGATTTLLFFMFVTGYLIVAAPVLNSSLYDELRKRGEDGVDAAASPSAAPSP